MMSLLPLLLALPMFFSSVSAAGLSCPSGQCNCQNVGVGSCTESLECVPCSEFSCSFAAYGQGGLCDGVCGSGRCPDSRTSPPQCIDCDFEFGNANCVELYCPTRRRALKGVGDGEEYRKYADVCADYDYDTAIYVNKHMFAVASPKEEAVASGCPFLVTHALMGEDTPRKEVLVFLSREERNSFLTGESHLEDGMYHMGSFQFSDLYRVLDETEFTEHNNGVYDIVVNNCGNYMVKLASSLNIKIDSQVTNFVAHRILAASGKDLMDKIRSSANYFSLFHGRALRPETVPDKELVELLVEASASGL